MKTKILLISFVVLGLFVALAMTVLFYLPSLLEFQGYAKYVLSILCPLLLLFVYLRRSNQLIRLVKRRQGVKKIIKKWYENHPEKYKKSFVVGKGVFKGGVVFESNAVWEKISPRDVFLETRAETDLGLKWIDDCINLIDKKYNLKELLK